MACAGTGQEREQRRGRADNFPHAALQPSVQPLFAFPLAVDWAERFLLLLERYSDTIKGQMYAHVHQEYFALMRGSRGQPLNIGFVNPSLTTHVYCYPSFRVYEMNEFSHSLIDYVQYHLDLARANKELKAQWEVAYRFSEYYQVPDLSLESHEVLVEKMRVTP